MTLHNVRWRFSVINGLSEKQQAGLLLNKRLVVNSLESLCRSAMTY